MLAQEELEKAYKNRKKRVDLSKTECGLPYSVNFKAMKQTRIDTNRCRPVRRVPLKKGNVAFFLEIFISLKLITLSVCVCLFLHDNSK